MTILRVSGYSGKNIESAKLEVFPNVTKRQTQSEMTIFSSPENFAYWVPTSVQIIPLWKY
jgi:hypothetical protein